MPATSAAPGAISDQAASWRQIGPEGRSLLQPQIQRDHHHADIQRDAEADRDDGSGDVNSNHLAILTNPFLGRSNPLSIIAAFLKRTDFT
jgi:hypothetical protein